MTDFGARFTKAREAQGLSLEQIAGETRISTRFLRAIEQEDFHILPGGIFNRGFIRTYAQRIGLDPEQAVAEYERIFTPTVPEPLTSVIKEIEAAPAEAASAPRPQRDYYPVAVALLILLIAVFYVLNRNSSTTEHIPSPAPSATQVVQAADRDGGFLDPVDASEQTGTALSASLAEGTAGTSLRSSNSPASSEPLVVELQANSVTWIRLSADGTVVEEVILQPGNARRYTAQNSLEISIGNAGGISMKVNGRDMGSLGMEGDVRRLLITPDNASTIGG